MKRQTAIKRTAITHKLKQCKGNGVAVGYGCGHNSINRQYGLCKDGNKCYYRWLADSVEGQKKVAAAVIPIVKKREDFKAAEKQMIERKSISTLLSNTKNALHAFIRERDKGLRCCACGCEYKPDFQASHFYSSNSFSSMRFLETNIHNTCCQCNLYNEGNIENFRIGLVSRYGQQYVDDLDKLAQLDKLQITKWSREDLDKMRRYFTAKLALIKTTK